MNRALLRKEWKQARLDVLAMLVLMCAVWLGTSLGRGWLLLPYGGDDEEQLLPLLAVFAGLQLAAVQFATESLWRTRDRLVFRGSGPAAAFRAKGLVAALGTTLFAVGPVLVLSAWLWCTSPWAQEGYWRGAFGFALLGTLAWPAWGLGSLCCQLRHGWGWRIAALLLSGAGLYAAAAMATAHLVNAPPWADLLFPLANALLGVAFAACAGRLFSAGIDDDVALRDGRGIVLAAGVLLSIGFPLALLGPAVSRWARDRLARDLRLVVETPDGGFALGVADWDWVESATEEFGGRFEQVFEPPGKLAFDPQWIGQGWPEPSAEISFQHPGRPFPFRGHWDGLSRWSVPPDEERASVFYETRSRRVHAFVHGPETLRHTEADRRFSPSTLTLWSYWASVLVDLEHDTLTLVRVEGPEVALEPLELPGGDQFVGVERLVKRRWAEVSWRPPFRQDKRLLVRGAKGRYRFERGALEPYVAEEDDEVVPAALADGLARLGSRYARYDALDPTIEVFDASDGRSLFTARLAPPGPRTEASKALACAASLLCAPVAALASFANREPWREPQRGRAVFEDQALLGGRRPWLLAANLGLAAWLAWRVRRETRAWGRSPWLGRCWVAATLLLGAVGWASFRLGEPRPARAEPARERSGRAPAAAGSDGVALGAR